MSSMPPPMPPPIPPRVPPPVMTGMPIVRPLQFLPPAPRRRRWVIPLFAVVGALLIAGAGLVGLRTYKLNVLDKHLAASIAPIYVSSPAADNESRAISSALDRLNSSMQRKSVESTAAMFDTERLADELTRLRLVDTDPAPPKTWWNQTVTQNILLEWFDRTWATHKVTKVLLSGDGNNALVYDMEYHEGPERSGYKVRWWMHKNANRWLFWDREYLESGPRTSVAFAASVCQTIAAQALSPITEARQKIGEFAKATKTNDLAAAEVVLNELGRTSLPPEMKAVTHVEWVWLHFRQDKDRDVLSDCDAIEATGMDMPIVNYYRAVAYGDLGEWARSLEFSLKWEAATGAEENSLYWKGQALAALKRIPEAIATYRKSVEFDPESAGSLSRMSKLLPAGRKPEIARLFMLCRFPRTVFRNAVPDLQRSRDLDGMEELINAYQSRPESKEDPYLTYYDSELKIIRKNYKVAEAQLRTLIPLAKVKDQECFEDEYLYCSFLAGDALAAYGEVPDKQAAFLSLARRLLGEHNATLTRLVAIHLPGFPNDPWAHYYNAKLYEALKQPRTADAAYAHAMALAGPDDLPTIRSARVYARFAAGDGLSAYRDIRPSDEVFSQLANLFSNKEQAENLSRLVSARRSDAPQDPALPLWEGEARYLAGDYESAVEALKPLRGTFAKGNGAIYRWRNVYIRSQVRLKRFDLARAEATTPIGEYKNWFQIALVECVAGNIAEATHAMDAELADDEEANTSEFYDDPDIGPAIAKPAFAAWRQKHPRPATRPSDGD